eukprot:322754_1
MGNNNCCGCNETPNRQKELLMKQKLNINKNPKQTNKTQKNKHITEDKQFKPHESNNNEDKLVKDKISPITDTTTYAPHHNEDKYMSNEPSKIDFDVFQDENDINKCDKNNINNDPIKACKPLQRLISSL